MKVKALQGDTVDLLCWRHYGTTQGVTEKVLSANPGLSVIPSATMAAMEHFLISCFIFRLILLQEVKRPAL